MHDNGGGTSFDQSHRTPVHDIADAGAPIFRSSTDEDLNQLTAGLFSAAVPS